MSETEQNYLEYIESLEKELQNKDNSLDENAYNELKDAIEQDFESLNARLTSSNASNASNATNVSRNISKTLSKQLNALHLEFLKVFEIIDDAKKNEQNFDYKLIQAKVKFHLECACKICEQISKIKN